MSLSVKTYIKGFETVPALNLRDLELELNFDKDNNRTEVVSATDLEFHADNTSAPLADAVAMINAELAAGTGVGPGLFEGIPFRIDVSDGITTQTPFDGYIDLTESRFSREVIEAKIKEQQKLDWLQEIAGAVDFAFLERLQVGAPGRITANDYVYMPYVLNTVPDYKDAAIAILSVYVLEQQIKEAIQKVIELGVEITNPFEITAIIRAALYVVYLTTLVAAILNLIKTIVNLIIQPVKYHACMKVTTLIEKACAHLGLTFRSSIFYNTIMSKAVIMPEKYYNPINAQNDQILGFTLPSNTQQQGFYKGTFGQLLESLKTMFNAKIVIQEDPITGAQYLYFERRDFNITPPLYTLPDDMQRYEYPMYETNANEFSASTYLKFITDPVDKNTLQEYGFTAMQVNLRPPRITNPKLVLMKGSAESFIDFPFALAKRKTILTTPEKIVKAFLDVASALLNALIDGVNGVINALNAIIDVVNSIIDALDFVGINVNWQIQSIPTLPYTNFGSIIENRKDMMKIEIDTTSVAKIFLMDQGAQPKFNKLSPQNEFVMSAPFLYDNYHYINSFFPTVDKPNGNQYIIRQLDRVPNFGMQEYLQVKNNNQVRTHAGEDAIIESLKWRVYDQTASMRIRVSKLLTNNFEKTTIIPDGR